MGAAQPGARTWVIATLSALALATRFATIDSHMYSTDEWLTIANVRGLHADALPSVLSAGEVQCLPSIERVLAASLVSDGGNGILYYLMMFIWSLVTGPHELVARFPSALAGVLVVLLTWRIACILGDERLALFAGLLAALHPMLVRYSQDARAYSLCSLFVVASTLVYLHLRCRSGWRLTVSYGFLVGCALLSHYLSISMFLAHALNAAATRWPTRAAVRMAVGLLIGGVMLSSWLFLFGGLAGLEGIREKNEAYQRRAQAAADNDEDFALPATPENIARGWVQMGSHVMAVPFQLFGTRLREGAALLVLPLGLGVWGLRVLRRSARVLLVSLSLAPLVFATLLALRSGHIIAFQQLYATWAAPFACLAIGSGIARAVRRGSRPVAVIAAITFMIVVGLGLLAVWLDMPWRRPRNPYPELATKMCSDRAGVLSIERAEATRVLLYLPRGCPLRIQITDPPAEATQ